jgi:hypothetical protein
MTLSKSLSSIAVLTGLVLTLPACSSTLSGTSSSYLIIDSLDATQGASANGTGFGGQLESDVCQLDQDTGGCGIVEDLGRVTMSMALKDPGAATIANVASDLNFITVRRYHVQFIRADGRNTPGVDVPYAFDGGLTMTVGLGGAEQSFTLVRVQAKEEAPLRALRGLGGRVAIATIAQVTFYGTDQTGRDVTVTGNINVNFADWADQK